MKKIILSLLILFYSFTLYSQVNLGVGLMAYYPFNGNANDVSGNNNNPVFNNATLTTDRLGNPNSAYHFNGSNNYMQIPNHPTLNMANQMSISLWVKPTGYYTGPCYNNMMVMKGNIDFLTGNYFLRFADDVTGCTTPNTTQEHFYGEGPVAQTPLVQLNQWYSVVYTNDGITSKIYVNCILRASAPTTVSTFSNIYDVFFGRMNNPTYPYWLNGDLDEVRIYNRALTTDEVNVLGGCNIATACVPTFQKLIGGNKAEYLYHIEANPDGSFVTAGFTSSFGNGSNDGYLQKMDNSGNLLWSKTFGGSGNDYFNSVKPTTDGGYIMAGSTASFGGSANGVAWLVKTDANGTMQWSRKYDDGNANGSIIWDVTATTDGGYALSGQNRYVSGLANGMVIKTDNTGAVVWAKSFDSNNSDGTMSSLEDANTLIVISFQYGQSSSFYDGVIMKLNITNGSVIWARNYDMESKSNWPRELFKTSTGYSFSCYQDVGFSAIAPELVVLNTDLNGNPLSLKKVTGSPSRYGYYVPTSDGGFITAQTELITVNDDIHLVKVNAAGGVQWNRRFGGTGLQYAYDITQSPDGGYLMAGYNNATPAINDSANIYILKTDSLGNTPGCNTSTTTVTVSTPAFTVNSAFAWSSITNLSFSPTAVTPVSANPNISAITLCSSTCQPLIADTIINDYTSVLSFDVCTNFLNVEDCLKFNIGDTVLLIQMKGAVIDSSNTAAFGTITNYRNAGNYEFNFVKSINGNLIELKDTLTRKYDFADGKVQLIRVPYLQNSRFNARLTCLPWDGSKGGVVVLNVRDSVILNADIDVSGKGFRGGIGFNIQNAFTNCFQNNFTEPLINNAIAGQKGESIASLSQNIICGKGSPAGGGGGGMAHNSGGGGGANGGTGGFGGYQLESCGNSPFNNRGIGGKALTLTTASNKIFMGSGGGAGQADNPGNIPPAGGNGAGIIIINSNYLKSNSYKILANGNNGIACSIPSSPDCHDGMGGGGAGGSILMSVNQILDNSTTENKGGNGADMVGSVPLGGRIGAGGGGGGGLLFIKNPSLPANLVNTNTGGANGVLTTDANNPWGATAGTNGITLFNLIIPVDQVPYKGTFDSAKLNIDVISCTFFKFAGLTNVDSSKIVRWQWNFGDGTIDSVKNVIHEYVSPGVYPVKLIATDKYGCVATFTVDLIIHCRCEEIKITSPNPATDFITVSGLGCGINTLILYNMLGQKITEVSGDHSSETIQVSNLPKAMYIVKVINKNKVVANLKVIKL